MFVVMSYFAPRKMTQNPANCHRAAIVCTNIHSGDDFQKFIKVLSKEQEHLVPLLLTDGGEMLC